jgi:hypothetical protein
MIIDVFTVSGIVTTICITAVVLYCSLKRDTY